MHSKEMEANPLGQVTVEDYRVWRHHPVTKVLYKYLQDYQQVLEAKALAHLLEDSDMPLNPKYVGEISGRVKAVAEIQDLPFEAIKIFYQKEEENAAPTSTDTDVQNFNWRVPEGNMERY